MIPLPLVGSSTLQPGAQAPDFSLAQADGTPVRLQQLLARGPVVIFFYPKDETPGCTAEACAFRDSHEAFLEAGAQVVGISDDDSTSHTGFAQRHRLPFPLLSDPGGEIRSAYGVGRWLGLFKNRVTFVIAPDGTIRHVFESQLQATRHVAEALTAIRSLRSP